MRALHAALVMSLVFVATAQSQPGAPPTGQPATGTPAAADPADRELAQRVERLVQRLTADRAADRESAEKDLLELGGATSRQSDRLLEILPEPTEQMSPALRDRLTQIRKQIEYRAAKAAVTGTTISLSANQMSLAEVLAAIEKQTGNRLQDKGQQFGAEADAAAAAKLTVKFEGEPFWSAVDQILDQMKLGTYNFGEADVLSIVPRGPDDGPRRGAAAYSGPFRFEVLEIQGQRNQRQPGRKTLKLQLEVAWEPRLRPIALSQPAIDLTATDETGKPIVVTQLAAVHDVEVPTGTQAAEIVLPFELPLRDVKQVASLRGKMKALVPGRRAQFSFGDLANAAGKNQRRGGVQVIIDAVRKNNIIWEIHMRLSLDEANRALESHRGWVFQNVSYLVDENGKRIQQAGFETTRQTPNEVGVAYLFQLPEGKANLDGLKWIYETPAAIVELPVEYEIKKIDLP